jgi:mRNA interferase MazF
MVDSSALRQGDVYWIDAGVPVSSGPGYLHPCVVIQSDVLNRSRIATVVVAMITSNLRLANAPGNVLLSRGEANLGKPCVVNVTQLFTVGRDQLEEKLGRLGRARMEQVLDGVRVVLAPE